MPRRELADSRGRRLLHAHLIGDLPPHLLFMGGPGKEAGGGGGMSKLMLQDVPLSCVNLYLFVCMCVYGVVTRGILLESQFQCRVSLVGAMLPE